MNSPELLAPAGSLEMMRAAFSFGADAVYAGRCLLSGYFTRRDSNQGACTNSCRLKYKLHEEGNSHDDGLETFREESQRPGELMPIEEDEHGTYILNSKDLRAVEHVPRLIEIGVDSFKFEGRTKSPYYVARSCQAYRRVIDDSRGRGPGTKELLARCSGRLRCRQMKVTAEFSGGMEKRIYRSTLLAGLAAMGLLVGACVKVPAARQQLLAKPNMVFDDTNSFAYSSRLLPQSEPGTAVSGGAPGGGCTACR